MCYEWNSSKLALNAYFAQFQENMEPPKSQQQWGAKQVCEHLNHDACNK
jgi:hypothetical protein